MVTKPSAPKTKTIAAGAFKAHCLRLLDEVRDKHVRLIITKHGKPVAEIGPASASPPSIVGSMAGTIEIVGDIVEPIDVEWEGDEPNIGPHERARD